MDVKERSKDSFEGVSKYAHLFLHLLVDSINIFLLSVKMKINEEKFAGIGEKSYLCTRKSAYCAGLYANNTLIKSNLAFKNEVVGVPFLSGLSAFASERPLKKGIIILINTLFY